MSKNKEKIFFIIIATLMASNIFFIGKTINENDKSQDALISQFINEEEEIEHSEIKKLNDNFPSEIMVHIGGAVVNPGVYKLSTGSKGMDLY